ncbi:MAG: hypothetical protein KZQ58_09080 [gamma proteobacterium symbiont of Bathyaustriella thionipta]|nr:hypothetical protein [gamma proteobacterium symbiont of Bathyaustriella thionipta]
MPDPVSLALAQQQPDAKLLTRAILQISNSLHFYHAELARILNYQCRDIGQLANAEQYLKPQSIHWQQALLLLRFYDLLDKKFASDEAAMCHWLRKNNMQWNDTPLMMMVDKQAISILVQHLEHNHNLV